MNVLSATATPNTDPALTPVVTASIEEIEYAQQLRRRIEERYLNRPAPLVPLWSVGAD